MFRRHFPLYVALLVLSGPLLANDDALIERLEKAVVTGSTGILDECRSQLAQRAAGSEATPMDRYNLAYANWRIAQQLMGQKQNDRIEPLLEEAQELLGQTLKERPDDPEVLSLQAGVMGLRIGTSMWRGMRLGPKIGRLMDKALRLAPDNPRVVVQQGIGSFHTPRMFGGGIKKAEGQLGRAVDLFARQPKKGPWPNWGRVDALTWLGQVKAKQKKKDEARALYQQVLALEPEMAWVRWILLPALDK